MRLFAVLVVAALCGAALADCPNACSGHGDCTTNWDYCTCYNGWMGNDCSQQLCPFGLSFIDTPNGDIDGDNEISSGGFDSAHLPFGSKNALNPLYRKYGYWEAHPSQLYGVAPNGGAVGDLDNSFFPVQPNEGHFYSECSNRGICDRATGLCGCFTGYEGAACNRTACANKCSGHGVCKSINEVTPDNLHYRLWDADKTQVCDCDGGYFGPDCSMKKCMRNDDPLTTMTSQAGANSGLNERGEVQYVDVRCPYYGGMLGPAYVTLTYTDTQFGDQYETPMFDILTATGSQIQALLKALPNQVLADYADVNTVTQKVPTVTVTTIDSGNYYRIWVTFAASLGNVPTLMGTPYFKCRGGAEVISDGENVLVTYDGDGPAYDLTFSFSTITATTAHVVVTNSSGASLEIAGGTSYVTHTFATGTNKIAAGSLNFGREAAKVNFQFSFGAGDRTTNNAAGSGVESLAITIHTQPVVSGHNVMYVLKSAGILRSSLTATNSASTILTDDSTFTSYSGLGPYGGAADVDWAVEVEVLSATTAIARVTLNGEIFGLVTLTSTTTPLSGLLVGALGSPWPAGAYKSYLDALKVKLLALADGDLFALYFPKTPYAAADYYSGTQPGTFNIANLGSGASIGVPSKSYFSSGLVDDIWPTYTQYQAPRNPFTLVLQITRINTAHDEYRWKIAGDMAWSDTFYVESGSLGTVTTMTTPASGSASFTTYPDSTVTGVTIETSGQSAGSAYIPSAVTPQPLYNIKSFLRAYPDDPTHHDVQYVALSWQSGADNQLRQCNTDAATYYLQFGSDGLNDSPVCSDRGVCDFTSGICKCFKGYAGIDCTTQNALSMGAGAGGASGSGTATVA